jgi:hypothetical protein
MIHSWLHSSFPWKPLACWWNSTSWILDVRWWMMYVFNPAKLFHWSLGLSPYARAAPTRMITVDLSLHTQVTQKLCKPFRHVRRWLEPLGHPSASSVPQSHGYVMMCRQIRPHKGCRVWPGSVSQTIQNLDTCWYLSNYLDISWYELR